MTDYGAELRFGYFPVPLATDIGQLVSDVRYCDRAGVELVGIQDHPYQRRFLDTFSLIAWLGAKTARVRFFSDVANLPLRPPAMLAKAASSMDLLTGGRFELGLGAGAFWEAVAAYGGPRRAAGEAVTALEEAIAVIRAMWTDQRSANFGGRYYSVKGAKPGPLPAHDIGIWLGATGPRMLGLCGRLADGWVPSSGWATPERLAAMNGQIDEAAAAAGRSPSDIRRIYNVNGRITSGTTGGFLDGPADQWIEELTDLAVAHGMDSFVFWPSDGAQPHQLQRFAEEVAPGAREAVRSERESAR